MTRPTPVRLARLSMSALLAACGGAAPPPPAAPVEPAPVPATAAPTTPPTAPATFAPLPDLRAQCTEGRAAVIRRGAELLPQATLAEAFAAVRSDDLLRICPGPRFADATLTLSGPERLTIDATDAVLVGPWDGKAVAISGVRDLRVVGWSLNAGGNMNPDEPAVNPVVSLEHVQGVAFEDVSLAAGGGPALWLVDAKGFAWTRGLVTDAATVVTADEATQARFADLRFARVKEAAAPGPVRDALTAAAQVLPEPEAGKTPPPADPTGWPDAARLLKGRHVRPLLFRDGKAFVHLFHEMGRPAALLKPGADPYQSPPFKPTRAPKTAGEAVLPRAERASLTVFTPTGACTPKVGEPLYIATDGCEPSYATVLPLEGCGAAMAPLVIGSPAGTGAVPALTWSPLETTKLEVAAGAAPAPHLAEFAEGSLTRSLARDWAHLSGATSKVMVRWQLGAPAERLDALLLGFQFDLENCNIFADQHRAAWRVAGGKTERWAVPGDLLSWHPLSGALLHGGQIAGLVGTTVTDAALVLRHVDGAFEQVWTETFFDDNDECTPWGTDIDFESPCAP
jgi:hypothetical protein